MFVVDSVKMFQRYELERLLYVHPTFLALWNADVMSTARYILQSQVVNHVSSAIELTYFRVQQQNKMNNSVNRFVELRQYLMSNSCCIIIIVVSP